jgi:hypothetical protein
MGVQIDEEQGQTVSSAPAAQVEMLPSRLKRKRTYVMLSRNQSMMRFGNPERT